MILDAHAPNMQPLYDVYATIAFSAYPGNVRTTIVNGEIVVADREMKQVDMANHWREWKKLTDRVGKFAKTLE